MTRFSLRLACALLTTTGCYQTSSVLDRTDGGVDAGTDARGAGAPDAGHDGGVDGGLALCPPGTVTIASPRVSVQATGAVTYTHGVGGLQPAPIEVEAILTSVDVGASTLHLAIDGDTTHVADVVVGPVDAAVLAALPIGAPLAARFEDGLTLSDVNGELVLAVVSVDGALLNAGPFELARGADDCLSLFSPSPSSDCTIGMIPVDVEVGAVAFAATLTREAPTTTATLGARTYTITLARSDRNATRDDARPWLSPPLVHCALLLQEELGVVVSGR